MSTTVSEVLASSIFRIVEEGPKSLNDAVTQEIGTQIDTAGKHFVAFFSV